MSGASQYVTGGNAGNLYPSSDVAPTNFFQQHPPQAPYLARTTSHGNVPHSLVNKQLFQVPALPRGTSDSSVSRRVSLKPATSHSAGALPDLADIFATSKACPPSPAAVMSPGVFDVTPSNPFAATPSAPYYTETPSQQSDSDDDNWFLPPPSSNASSSSSKRSRRSHRRMPSDQPDDIRGATEKSFTKFFADKGTVIYVHWTTYCGVLRRLFPTSSHLINPREVKEIRDIDQLHEIWQWAFDNVELALDARIKKGAIYDIQSIQDFKHGLHMRQNELTRALVAERKRLVDVPDNGSSNQRLSYQLQQNLSWALEICTGVLQDRVERTSQKSIVTLWGPYRKQLGGAADCALGKRVP